MRGLPAPRGISPFATIGNADMPTRRPCAQWRHVATLGGLWALAGGSIASHLLPPYTLAEAEGHGGRAWACGLGPRDCTGEGIRHGYTGVLRCGCLPLMLGATLSAHCACYGVVILFWTGSVQVAVWLRLSPAASEEAECKVRGVPGRPTH